MKEKPGESAAGFTLLELMIALALVSLLSLVAFMSMNLSLKAVGRGQAAAENLQELRVGQGFMERSLSSAAAGLKEVKEARTYFFGEPQQIRFFTFLPLEAFNLGGIYHWRVLVGRNEAGQGVLAVEQTKSINWTRDPEGVEIRQILLKNVTSVRFFYGSNGKEYDNWDARRNGGLPDWVKVRLALGNQKPQEWLIPIHVFEIPRT
ncbi:MAG: prepilin-type N-terminal cleavage/methylation domain-containing protein [Syntrophales bacterium]|nr:prepilin-type N-terminal cleavage/methylation domain-containing protein [Syntrophales bacterium]